jgi:hypothetical protein
VTDHPEESRAARSTIQTRSAAIWFHLIADLECGGVVYGPPLIAGCRILDGAAAVR